MTEKKRIVILGAGFAGIYTYLGLKKYLKNFDDVEIVLIDKKNYFLFVPMLHEVATGNLEPSSVVQPIRQAIDASQIRFIEGRVDSIDLDKQEVKINLSFRAESRHSRDGVEESQQLGYNEISRQARDDSVKNIMYDYLVLALGSTHNFFNTPGAERCLVLKDLDDAQRIRRQIIGVFETANNNGNETEIRKLLTFIIIGGGPTGVELVGELADLVNHEIKKAYPQLYSLASIHLIHAGAKLVEQVDEWFHVKTKSILEKMGVQLHLKHRVTNITERGACFDETEWIDSSNVFWTAGVKAVNVSFAGNQLKQVKFNERDGRIGVDQTLKIPNLPNIFVAGDQMCLTDKETGQPYPMRAQFAAKEGMVAGYNLAHLISHGDQAQLKNFKWKDQGFIISLGSGGALAKAYGLKISGPLAWWLYRTAYLFKLVGARAKLKTAFEWTINLFLPRDISKT